MWRRWWSENWQGNRSIRRELLPSHTLSTTNPTRTELGIKPGLRSGEPATNRLSYGTAVNIEILHC
jgi:hypothetical protein